MKIHYLSTAPWSKKVNITGTQNYHRENMSTWLGEVRKVNYDNTEYTLNKYYPEQTLEHFSSELSSNPLRD